MKSPLPPHNELLEYLCSFDFFSRQGLEQAGRDYASYHLQRFVRSLELLPALAGNAEVLELGACPYFMTVMVEKYLGYKITAANFHADYGDAILSPEAEITLSSSRYRESYTYRYKMFNVERDPFPYPSGSFDMVLCCEILEHLPMDPSRMLCESHRVLKPGGSLFITTPNVLRLSSIYNLIYGRNIHFPYSTDGVYGRHNREYTPGELSDLLKLHNFEPEIIVDDAYPHDPYPRDALYQCLSALGALADRADNLFAIAKKCGDPVRQYPDWLYAGYKKRPEPACATALQGARPASAMS